MSQVTLKADEILPCLLSLPKRLAEAISWVSRRSGGITFEIPDALSLDRPGLPPPLCSGTCRPNTKPKERVDVEIFVGILTEMERTGPSASKPKSHK